MFEEVFIPESVRIIKSIRMDTAFSLGGPEYKEFDLEGYTAVETNLTTYQELKTFLVTYSLGPLVQLVISGLNKKDRETVFLKDSVGEVN